MLLCMQEPNDFQKAFIEALETIDKKDDRISELSEEVAHLKFENEALRTKLHQVLHDRYGKKSEKVPDEELPVLDEAVVTAEEAIVIAEAEATILVPTHERNKPKRRPLPKDLPREIIRHELSLDKQLCNCGHPLHAIGEDSYEKLDYIPAQVKVIKHVCVKVNVQAHGIYTGLKIA